MTKKVNKQKYFSAIIKNSNQMGVEDMEFPRVSKEQHMECPGVN